MKRKRKQTGKISPRSVCRHLSLRACVPACVCVRARMCDCVFHGAVFVRTSRLDDLQLTQAFWAACAWARFPLSHANNGGLEAAMGISSDCKHRLFNPDSRLKMDLVFREVLCRYSWNLIPPPALPPRLVIVGEISAPRVRSIIVGFIIGAQIRSLVNLSSVFFQIPTSFLFFSTLQFPPA